MRLIDADALEPDAYYYDGEFYAVTVKQIEDAPTIEERKTGRWIKETVFCNLTRYDYHCSECGNNSLKKYSFCPHCGKKMRR